MTVFCGIDWAERHHDVALIDEAGQLVARRRIKESTEGLGERTGMLAAAGDRAEAPIPVAIETPRGLLVAALQPPLGRKLLMAKLDETARFGSEEFELFTNRWADGTVSPEGYRYSERFHMEGATPVWTFALADALLEKRIFMPSGANTTYILYRLVRASSAVELSIKVLADYGEEHCVTAGRTRPMEVTQVEHGLQVVPLEGAPPF